MPVKKRFEITSFRGINTAKAKTQIALGEMEEVNNFYIENGKLRQRPRILQYSNSGSPTDSQIPGHIYGIFDYKATTGDQQMVVMSDTSFYIRVSYLNLYTELLDPLGVSPPASTLNWKIIQYKGRGYAVRPDFNKIVAFDDTNIYPSGMAAPTTAPTVAPGAVAGYVEAGDYYGVVTFYDPDTGYESNPSPVSALFTRAGFFSFAWSNIPVSTDPRAKQRRLYRTIANQVDEYYLVATVPDNTSTTYGNDVLGLDSFGPQASFNNTPPKSDTPWLDITNAFERVWATDGKYLFYSESGLAESMRSTNFLNLGPDDGQPQVAVELLGDTLLLWKEGSLWSIVQSAGPFPFLPRKIDDRNGCASADSVKCAAGKAFWYTGATVCMSDGGSAGVDISTPRVKSILDSIPNASKARVVAAVYPSKGWYVLAFDTSATSITENDTMLVYDYNIKEWFTFTFNPDSSYSYRTSRSAPSVFGEVEISGVYIPFGATRNFTASAEYVYKIFESPGDSIVFSMEYGTKMLQSVRTKAIDFGESGKSITVSRVGIACPAVTFNANSEFFDIELYLDDDTVPYRTISSYALNPVAARLLSSTCLSGRRSWKYFDISSDRKRANSVSVRVVFDNLMTSEFRIEGLFIEGEVWDSRERSL